MEYPSLASIIVALLGSAGLWGFLSQARKLKHEKERKEQDYIHAFNASLAAQVEMLSTKIDRLAADKEQLLIQMAELKAQLAEANTTIKHLEEMLRQRHS